MIDSTIQKPKFFLKDIVVFSVYGGGIVQGIVTRAKWGVVRPADMQTPAIKGWRYTIQEGASEGVYTHDDVLEEDIAQFFMDGSIFNKK